MPDSLPAPHDHAGAETAFVLDCLAMYRPLALFIGLRYLRGKRRNRFATFVSFASVLGVATGVAVLIIVLSVMNGFEREVAGHILGMTSHATVFRSGESMQDWPRVAEAIRRVPGVTGVQPFIRGSAMINRRGRIKGVVVYGIPREAESEVSDLARYLGSSRLDDLAARAANNAPVFLGETLADTLDAQPGDSATLIIPRWSAETGATQPRYAPASLQGIFRVGMHEFDSAFVLMDLPVAAGLFDYGQTVTGLRVRFTSPGEALAQSARLQEVLGPEYVVLDWSRFHRNFFQALQSQKRILFLILSVIIGVAAFNVVASMIMVVKEKRRDIAILRTQGCTAGTILGAFVIQGLLIGTAGVGLGLATGMLGAEHANDLMRWLERSFDLKLIKADVYYIDYLPTRILLGDVLRVTGVTLGICLFATLYPAWRAAQVAPVEALRYE